MTLCTKHQWFHYKLVGLPSFAWDFYCQLCLYVSLFLCLSISVSLSLPSISPKPNLTLNMTAWWPSHPPLSFSHPLPRSFQIRNSLLRLIFGWTSSFIIKIYIYSNVKNYLKTLKPISLLETKLDLFHFLLWNTVHETSITPIV
jgi:hypothetical protein